MATIDKSFLITNGPSDDGITLAHKLAHEERKTKFTIAAIAMSEVPFLVIGSRRPYMSHQVVDHAWYLELLDVSAFFGEYGMVNAYYETASSSQTRRTGSMTVKMNEIMLERWTSLEELAKRKIVHGKPTVSISTWDDMLCFECGAPMITPGYCRECRKMVDKGWLKAKTRTEVQQLISIQKPS